MFKLAKYLKPYKKECVIGPAFKLLEAILELLLPTLMALVINNGVAKGDLSYVLKMGGVMLLMSVLGFGSSMVCQYYAARASQGFGTILRDTLFKHISSFSFAELDRFGTPTLINRITNDVNQLQLAVAMLIRLVIRAPFICIGATVMAMILNFRLSLILLAATPVFAVILYIIIKKTSPLYAKYQQKLDRIALLLRENLSGVRVIRAFAKKREEKRRFDDNNDDLTRTAIRVGKISALLSPLTSVVMNAAIIAILWLGGVHINTGTFSQGEIIAFINYITQILLALIVVSNLVIIFTKANASAGRVNEILATVPSIPVEDADGRGEEAGKADPDAPLIRFDHVSFGYSTTGDTALTDISLDIGRGETIGIIGGTGSGKTTLVNLIPRFYDATEGKITVEGRNVKDFPLHALRKKIGMAQQKAVLFTGTVAQNIRWGNPEASDEEVQKAAAAAQASEFIRELPEQYSTMVQRGGTNFSGGQRQRLTIARALAVGPEILILDDSTSALDYATDAALRKAIRQYNNTMTILIVTQRASTVMHADKIVVLDDGHIAGIGTHDALMAECEAYREIYLSQTEGGEAAS